MPSAGRFAAGLGGLAAALLAASGAPRAQAQGAAAGARGGALERVLLVTVDSVRADEVGAAGGPPRTPHLDRLAREGVLVDGAYTPVPSTGPAHASLLTGLHPWHNGVDRNELALDPRTPTLADAARARGLATAAFVSSQLLSDRFGFQQGFDHFGFDPTEPLRLRGRNVERFWSRGEATAREAMRWLTAHANGPFLLWVNLADPAPPFELPPGHALPPQGPIDLPAGRLPAGVRDAAQLTRLIRAHRAEVAYADAQLGALVERLRLLARLDETAVVLTSSHGEGLGDHGALVGGDGLFEESVRVPLVLRGPGLPAGRRLEGPAQLEDLAPTLMAWIGADPPASLDGRNLLPWLRGEAPRSPREAAFGRRRSNPRETDLFFAREGNAKWIGGADAPGTRFDLARDPHELAGQPGEAMPERLRRALAASAAADPAQGTQSR